MFQGQSPSQTIACTEAIAPCCAGSGGQERWLGWWRPCVTQAAGRQEDGTRLFLFSVSRYQHL